MTELHWTMARALAGLRWLNQAPGRVRETVETWRERDRLRGELAALPERTLQDIGLTRAQVLYETRKPVWKPVDRDSLLLRRRENTAITVTGTVVS